MATQTLLTYEQYRDLPELEGVNRELDEGRVIEIPHASFLHGAVQFMAAHLLKAHLEETGADFCISQNTSFLLAPDIERAPDVCLLRRSALETMYKVRGVLRGCPDLVVEVISESDSASDVDRKIEQYLRAGAIAVWALYPQTRHVLHRRQSGETSLLTSGQFLEEPELFPGLKILVDRIFAV